jgi:hypothetical protein
VRRNEKPDEDLCRPAHDVTAVVEGFDEFTETVRRIACVSFIVLRDDSLVDVKFLALRDIVD